MKKYKLKKYPGGTKKVDPSVERAEKVRTALDEGFTKLGRKILPTNVAMYAQEMLGNKLSPKGAKTPLTEKDLPPAELEVLRKAAGASKEKDWEGNPIAPGTIQYADYPTRQDDPYAVDPTTDEALKNAVKDPARIMQTTIGRAIVKKDEVGNRTVQDTFDFAGEKTRSGTYGKLLQYATENSSAEGEGVPVKIKLEDTKRSPSGALYKKGTKCIKKAANGIQNVRGDVAKTAVSALAENSLPGLGTALNLVDGVAGKATKKADGTYKSGGAEYLNSVFNPMAKVDALASGNLNDIVDTFTGGMGSKAAKAVGINLGKSGDDIIREENQQKELAEKSRLFNSTIAGVDETQHQKTQIMKKGGKAQYKLIEIEKGEIHTDKDFNPKTIGTIPHEKGGNKVMAAEGDVVFPTQKKSKFKTISKAIAKGDVDTLRKERDKLPEDADTADNGLKVGKSKEPLADYGGKTPISSFGAGLINEKLGVKSFSPELQNGQPKIDAVHKELMEKNGGPGLPKNTYGTDLQNGQPLYDRIHQEIMNRKVPGGETPAAAKGSGLGNGDGWGESAGIANKLVQGMKSPEKVKRTPYTTIDQKYTDQSGALRAASSQMRNTQSANARNLSGGSVAGMRAGMQAAEGENFSRQQGINAQEMMRADGIQAGNVERRNQTNAMNKASEDIYNDMDDRNKAAKQSYLDSAFDDISRQSQVKKQMKGQKAYEDKYLGIINELYKYKFDKDGTNIIFDSENSVGSSLPRPSTTETNSETTKAGNSVFKRVQRKTTGMVGSRYTRGGTNNG